MNNPAVSPSRTPADPRVMLRDGTVAGVRPTSPADVPALVQFFSGLTVESRYQRFGSVAQPPASLITRLADSADPGRSLTLVAERAAGDRLPLIAVASYTAIDGKSAEASFAVADSFQGKGLGTALLERLAAAAWTAGFRRFLATTTEDNIQMLQVFRDSGFEIRRKAAGGSIEVQLSLAPTGAEAAAEDYRLHLATTASLRPLLEPAAVAVIGASRDPHSIGRRVVDGMLAAGFRGTIYPVNPKARDIAGLRTFPSARDLPPGVDLAVVAVPAGAVVPAVADCGAAGVRALVVISAGFAEAGEEGRALQAILAKTVRDHGMRMVGPNCMGLLNANPEIRLNASFSPIFPSAGHVGLLSQSGALGLTILALAAERDLGFSTFVSVGNKADVSSNDLLEYWEADPATRVILLYLESFGNPRRFARLARRIGRQKPIVVVKSGRTRSGRRAAGSHTAALAASDVAVDALFHQSGVIRADTLDEMLDIATCLENQPLPAGQRLAIVTNAGGPGILAADACEAAGLALAEFSEATASGLAAALPAMASRSNPVDMIASASPEQYRRAIELALGAGEVDSLIVIFTPVDPRSAAGIIQAIREGVARARTAGGAGKPVLACVMAEPARPVPLALDGERIPAYTFPENAVRALGKVTAHAAWRRSTPALTWTFDDTRVNDARDVCRKALEQRGAGWLTHPELIEVLKAFGLPVLPGGVARTADEAVSLATAAGFPVVAKLSSLAIIHKTDIGGVRLDLPDAAAVRTAFAEITSAAAMAAPGTPIEGVLIQPMVLGGIETMMGITSDPLFGPLVGFGLGGIHVEILGDVRFRIAPLTDRDAEELVQQIRGFRLLQGYRGHPAGDVPAVRDTLLRLSRLAQDLPEVQELDLNPVMVMSPGQGCRIADARIKVG